MSETVDVWVKIQAEGREVLRNVQGEMKEFGSVSKDAKDQLNSFSSDIRAMNRVNNLSSQVFKVQHDQLYDVANAFGQVASVGRQSMSMISSYNTAMTRVNTATRNVAEAQRDYNEAVATYGEGSEPALSAAGKLKEAQEALTKAQTDNIALFVSMGLQVPAFVKNILGLAAAFSKLNISLGATAILGGKVAVALGIGLAAAYALGEALKFVTPEGLKPYIMTLPKIAERIQKLVGVGSEAMPEYQGGISFVRETGPAMLHRGESVISAARNAPSLTPISNTITISNAFNFTGGISSDLDIRDLARKVSRQIGDEINRSQGSSYLMR